MLSCVVKTLFLKKEKKKKKKKKRHSADRRHLPSFGYTRPKAAIYFEPNFSGYQQLAHIR